MFYNNFFIYIFFLYIIFVLSFFFLNKYVNTNLYALTNFIFLFVMFLWLCLIFKNIFFLNYIWNLSISSSVTQYLFIPNAFNIELNILNFSFLFLVVCIGCATNLYLFNYFKGEANEYLFIFWLNSFIISMMILVLSANLFTTFLGWELIGLSSFFLINFWSNRNSTLKSSYKAFIFNLFSDICLLGSFVIYYYVFGTDDIQTIIYLIQFSFSNNSNLLSFGTYLLVFCCSIKSVQLIGHLWLPDSMEAPVPASSLIHSATLVSAGIFLLNKFFFFIYSFTSLTFFLFWGALTALYGGLVCAAQTDVKKLLAYSTMSHCGFLWVLAICNNFLISILYLFLHGIFKAATFYCVGSFIRLFNTQDSRWMGNGLKYLPVDSFFLLFCSANLAGLPFTIGFFYKTFLFKIIFLSKFYFLILGFLLLASSCSLIYFYRLNFYILNDFYKNIKNITFFYFSKIKIKQWQNFSIVQLNALVAISFLCLVSILSSIIFFFFISNIFCLDFSFNINSLYFIFYSKIETFFNIYYLLFYFIYLCIFLWIVYVVFKNNNNLFEITNLFFYLLFFIYLKCELT